MFALFKSKNPYEQGAEDLYAVILGHIRSPAFYEAYGVPDTLDGRFDLLVLHVFMAMHILKEAEAGPAFNQTLFDSTFADMDQTLRETGIGDMGLPKHMRRMMKGFNGRVQSYEAALSDKGAMIEALKRNVYGTIEEPPQENLEKLYQYVQNTVKSLEASDVEALMAGNVTLNAP